MRLSKQNKVDDIEEEITGCLVSRHTTGVTMAGHLSPFLNSRHGPPSSFFAGNPRTGRRPAAGAPGQPSASEGVSSWCCHDGLLGSQRRRRQGLGLEARLCVCAPERA